MRRPTLRKTRALWFVFADIHFEIGAEPTRLQQNRLSGFWVSRNLLAVWINGVLSFFLRREWTCELAFRIIRATDKGSVATELQAKIARVAKWTKARLLFDIAVFIQWRKHMVAERVVQNIENR